MTSDLAASTGPSTSASSSSFDGVTLKAIIAQLQCMDALIDIVSAKLCQVNTCVSRIARRQARLGGFIASSPSPFLKALADEDSDDDGDEDASSSSDVEMTPSQ